ncbi:hypothetical protein D5272_14670 [bacterium D16-76]|nr:hypothetical protein [bacterium D16-76]
MDREMIQNEIQHLLMYCQGTIDNENENFFSPSTGFSGRDIVFVLLEFQKKHPYDLNLVIEHIEGFTLRSIVDALYLVLSGE